MQTKTQLFCDDFIKKLNLSWGVCCSECHYGDFLNHLSLIHKELKTGEFSYTCCSIATILEKADLLK